MAERLEQAAGPTATEIRRLCGELQDWKVAAIEATGATIEEVEEAAAWAAGDDEILGDARRALSGGAAAVYDLLALADDFESDEGVSPP